MMAVDAHHLPFRFSGEVMSAPEEYYNTLNSPPVPLAAAGVGFNPFEISPVSYPEPDFFSQLQQQQLEIDNLITNHTEKMRVEMEDRRSWLWRRVVAMAEEKVARRLRAKDEDLERMARMNHALEERVRSLLMENQLWRDIARSNEATAVLLKSNLDQVLASQEGQDQCEDVESCSGPGVDKERRRLCRRCREREAAVLLMPCRHLCLCMDCSPAMDACPVCQSSKNGTLVVNLS
ncbi:hypothetical protein J5N97_008658 [Dioscorea zingiberensis]|uniref:RING-type domain-containing protein n=1 Tax=Dioscorea zingiberensis TaxID=325984 RepID=A0A9D5HL26_9LILI|nr:hypothetical protein J5N97_008658 [Dioscorea zingiberensis]